MSVDGQGRWQGPGGRADRQPHAGVEGAVQIGLGGRAEDEELGSSGEPAWHFRATVGDSAKPGLVSIELVCSPGTHWGRNTQAMYWGWAGSAGFGGPASVGLPMQHGPGGFQALGVL